LAFLSPPLPRELFAPFQVASFPPLARRRRRFREVFEFELARRPRFEAFFARRSANGKARTKKKSTLTYRWKRSVGSRREVGKRGAIRSSRRGVGKLGNATACRDSFSQNIEDFFRKTLDLASVGAYNRGWRRFVALLTFGFAGFVNRFKINKLRRRRNKRSNESAGDRFLPGADARRD